MGNPIVRRRPNTEINPNKLQTKILGTNVQLNTTLSSFTFNNLQVGKQYHLTGVFFIRLDDIANDDTATVNVFNGATHILQLSALIGAPDSQADNQYMPINLKFTATATTITVTTVDFSTSSYIIGNGSTTGSYLQLEERNDVVDTTDFT